MQKSNSFNKREKEKNKQKKKKEKQLRREERKNHATHSFEDMIAYVDENGVLIDTPPDLSNKQDIDVDSIEVSTPKKEKVEEPKLNGKVEYFNANKGFGFIKNLDNSEKYFFHISSAPEFIEEGNFVTFELERGQRGMNAVAIVIKENATNLKE